jgi:hypothetical protein
MDNSSVFCYTFEYNQCYVLYVTYVYPKQITYVNMFAVALLNRIIKIVFILMSCPLSSDVFDTIKVTTDDH